LVSTLREEHRLRVSENSEPKREKLAGGRRRLHKEDLRKFSASANNIRIIFGRRHECGL
jgi:hypothetical protein